MTLGQLAKAFTTVLFNSITFPPRKPWSAVMTTLAWATKRMGLKECKDDYDRKIQKNLPSLMRAAKASALKPANITE